MFSLLLLFFFKTIFLHILCYDLWFYFSHIILHHPEVYFIHKIHHAKNYKLLHFLDTNEGHYIEHIVQPLGIFIPCFIYGFYIAPFCISFVIVGTRALMRHDDRCSWLIGNHHLLHHKYPYYNYGEFWIDTFCGTVCPYEKEYIYGILYT